MTHAGDPTAILAESGNQCEGPTAILGESGQNAEDPTAILDGSGLAAEVLRSPAAARLLLVLLLANARNDPLWYPGNEPAKPS